MSRLLRLVALLLAVAAVVGAVAYASRHHVAPIFQADGDCTTTVDGRTVYLDEEQSHHASLIAAISVERGLRAHAATIALAAAYQESKLYNLSGGDRDSVGLFQQRPSQGWGPRAALMRPSYAINKFYDALVKVDGYNDLRVTVAAQEVQRSGYPEAYAAHEADARVLASALTGYSPAAFSCSVDPPEGQPAPIGRRADEVRRGLATGFGAVSVRVRPGARIAVPVSSPERGWAVASYLVAHARELGLASVGVAGRTWEAGHDGWARSGPRSSRVVVVR